MRSSQPEVRNPVLALQAIHELIAASTPEQRVLWRKLLREIATVGHARAEKAWTTRKGPMAVYWRGVGVYANHIARALRP